MVSFRRLHYSVGDVVDRLMTPKRENHPGSGRTRCFSGGTANIMKGSLMMLIASCGEGCVQDKKGTQVQSAASRLGIRVFSVSRVHTHGSEKRGSCAHIAQDVCVLLQAPGTLPRWFGRHSRLFPACMENLRQPASVLRNYFFAFRTPGRRPKDGDGDILDPKRKNIRISRNQLLSATWGKRLLFVCQERPSVLGWERSQHKSLHQQ